MLTANKQTVAHGAEIAQERTLTDCWPPEVGLPVPNKDTRMTGAEADADQVVGQRAGCLVVIGPGLHPNSPGMQVIGVPATAT